MYLYRGQVKFGLKELRCFDDHLAQIIHQGLVQIKASQRYGIPMLFLNEPYDLDEEAAWVLWSSILDEMIFAFAPAQDYADIEAPIYRYQTEFIPTRSGLSHYQSQRIALGPYGEADFAAYDARRLAWEQDDAAQRLEGRLLFAKYFGYLHRH